MKDFLGSFAEGTGSLVRAFLFPAVVTVALWDFFILEEANRDPESIYARLRAIDGTTELLVIAGAALTLALLLSIVTPAATRWLEGYWSGRNRSNGLRHWFWAWRVSRHHQKRKTHIRAINQLAEAQSAGKLTASQLAQQSRHQSALRRYPEFPAPTMPTRLGNVLRSRELYGSTRYGLDAISMWDALLASVPASLADNQASRRTGLDMFVSTTVLPTLFLLGSIHAAITTPLTWTRFGVAAALGAVVMMVSYLAAVEAAKSYADSLAAVVDLGRLPLAKALGLTLPTTIADEQDLWKAVTGFSFWGHAVSVDEGWINTLEQARRVETPHAGSNSESTPSERGPQ